MVDDTRFEATWTRCGATITRYCVFAACSREAGLDLAAETFARFLTHGDTVSDEHVDAWLTTVARNLCASHHRSQSRIRRLETTLAEQIALHPAVAPAPDATGADPELVEALQRLASDEQLALYLRVVEQQPYAEVARALGRNEGATRMLVLRSLRRLKATLAPAQPLGAPVHEGGNRHA